jgi:hypothetical protein
MIYLPCGHSKLLLSYFFYLCLIVLKTNFLFTRVEYTHYFKYRAPIYFLPFLFGFYNFRTVIHVDDGLTRMYCILDQYIP